MSGLDDSSKEKRPKEKNRKFHGRPREYQADIQFTTRKQRFFIKASGPIQDLDGKEDSPPTSWKTIFVCPNFRVYCAKATKDTDFTVQGENVFFMKFKDGRRVRLYPNDYNRRNFAGAFRAIKGVNNIVNEV